MNNNLPVIPSDNEFNILQALSRNAAASGLYSGVGSEQKILMVLLAARELGVGPMTALNGGIWNIQGKIELSARLMCSMIRRCGHSITIKTISDQECTIEGKRADNGDTFTTSFTIQEAQKAGLIRQGSNWIKYPQDMLYARALSRLSRRLYADIIGNAYVEGEIREAQYEVINIPKSEKIEIKQEIETETPEEIEKKLLDFLSGYPEEDHQLIKDYANKYSSHWKKGISATLLDFGNKEKFLSDFTKWKKKQLQK